MRTRLGHNRLGLPARVAANVRTEPTFTVLSESLVLTGDYLTEYWDLHPAGDRIVVAQPVASNDQGATASGSERFIVVTNWFEELRQRMGSN